MAKTKKDVYEIVTDRILKALDAGIVPWRKPWATGANGISLRNRNGESGKPYRGINVWLTACSGFASPFWFTRKQMKKQGALIKKGEKGTVVTFWATNEKRQAGKPVIGSNGKPETYFMFKFYYVWNLEQIDGIKPTPRAERAAGIGVEEIDITAEPLSTIESAEKIMSDSPIRPTIRHNGCKAVYQPALDTITIPEMDSFESAKYYYATLFHEFGHATGHESRLDRDLSGLFGDHSYTVEELVAEMTSAFLCGVSEIDTDEIMTNSAAYIDNWRRKISADPRLVIKAAGDAQKATDKILGVEFEPVPKSSEKAKETA